MEKLSEEQRLKVSKMSDERLRTKLVQAGYREVDVAAMDRKTLLTTAARVISVETAYVPEGTEEESEEVGGEDGLAAGGEMQAEMMENRSLEERRLLLEEKKLQLEEKRWTAEQEEIRRQRLFQEQKWKEELELKRKDQLYRDSTAVQIKTWGDALRNVISKMPNDSIEIVAWFVSAEKLFDQLKVPENLQSVLI